MGFLFGEFIYRPLYNLLILAYSIIPYHDFGLAIILVTMLLKFLLVPLSKKQIQAQKKMQELQPKIKEIQEKYKKDKEKQSRALMDFYKENKANPFSGCLPTVFQLVFLIAIYRVLFDISKAGLVIDGKELYSFVANPGQINQYFLGIVDLSRKLNLSHLTIGVIPQLVLVVLAAAAQYFQIKMLMPAMAPTNKNTSGSDVSQIMSKQMLYLGPLMTLFIGVQFPAGLALYWLISTAFTIIQQRLLMKERSVVVGNKA
ncbi:MAG: YidC/Oxa1 family membrane protein insertase [Candidatus Pacebacteria bacterium]|nr:YidC/Oxa1 family membrane protein insertase [Candidatus Paceibacterota bacterium]MDR3583253.1 YidC/Oxa1 family membrane protein insertase [Candidatus Paceibacterota bacterium]